MHLSPRTIAKGVGVYFAAAVSGYLYLRSTKAPAPSPCGCGASRPAANAAGDGSGGWDEAPASPAGGQQTFDRLADRYDSCINVDETFMGVKLMRRWLMRRAEVCRACGAGGCWQQGELRCALAAGGAVLCACACAGRAGRPVKHTAAGGSCAALDAGG